MRGLEIVKSGVLTLIEDKGRYGYADIGIAQSGMADRYSGVLANRLLGNPPFAPLLELSLGGLELLSRIDTCIAVTGADAPLSVNGRSKKLWRTYRIEDGDTVKIGMAKRGQRIYIATKGGFEIAPILGSCSSTLREGIGIFPQKGDILPAHSHSCRTLSYLPPHLIPDFSPHITLRLLPGYQWEDFDQEAKETLLSSAYEVSMATDRMGCRLSGEAIGSARQIISEPIAYGAVQIPPDGQPIIMLNERQTIGGYPKLGTIIPIDAYMLSQAQPGTKITFIKIDLPYATEVSKKLHGFLAG